MKKELKINKWESIGFLFNIPNNKKEKLSKLYDRMTNYLLKNDISGGDEITTLIYAAIRRLVEKLPLSHKINWKNVYDNLIEYWKNYEDFKNSNPKLDSEVEYLRQFCNEYINKNYNGT